jgi:hypothetical protein
MPVRKVDITEEDRFFTNADKLLQFHIFQADGVTAQNITGWALSWVLKRRHKDADASALVTKTTGGGTISLTAPLTGDCELTVTDENTALMQSGLYWHELKRTDAGAETPLLEGTVVLLQSLHIT